MMDHRPRNEQLMHHDAPPTIRQLAEQTFDMQQEDHRENSTRRQRDDTMYRRSMDPRLTHTRKDAPDVTSIPKFTKEGIMQRQQNRKGKSLDAAEKQPEPEKPRKITRPPTMLHRLTQKGDLSTGIVVLLVFAAIAGVCVLCSCDWKKK
jgi:hypothetical protein